MIYVFGVSKDYLDAYSRPAGARFLLTGTPQSILPLNLSPSGRVRGGIKCAEGFSLTEGANVGTRWFGKLSSRNNNGCYLLVNAGGERLVRGKNQIYVTEETQANCKVLWRGKIRHQGLFSGSSEVALLKVRNPYKKLDIVFRRKNGHDERLTYAYGEFLRFPAERVAAEANAKGSKPSFPVAIANNGKIRFTGKFLRTTWTPVWLRIMPWLLAASVVLTLQLPHV